MREEGRSLSAFVKPRQCADKRRAFNDFTEAHHESRSELHFSTSRKLHPSHVRPKRVPTDLTAGCLTRTSTQLPRKTAVDVRKCLRAVVGTRRLAWCGADRPQRTRAVALPGNTCAPHVPLAGLQIDYRQRLRLSPAPGDRLTAVRRVRTSGTDGRESAARRSAKVRQDAQPSASKMERPGRGNQHPRDA
jgi:hypothetical protein